MQSFILTYSRLQKRKKTFIVIAFSVEGTLTSASKITHRGSRQAGR